jgi:hypothetical protein
MYKDMASNFEDSIFLGYYMPVNIHRPKFRTSCACICPYIKKLPF